MYFVRRIFLLIFRLRNILPLIHELVGVLPCDIEFFEDIFWDLTPVVFHRSPSILISFITTTCLQLSSSTPKQRAQSNATELPKDGIEREANTTCHLSTLSQNTTTRTNGKPSLAVSQCGDFVARPGVQCVLLKHHCNRLLQCIF